MCNPTYERRITTLKIDNLSFTSRLINWYTERKRDLPWRRTSNPYAIWLSEIILQQTRVDQGLPYWERFISTYPTISDLAKAPEDDVLRLWQGLGYYSRARNLHAAAKYVSENLDGKFPTSYNEIIKLKGVGPYTAAAISSICFNEARPVVDGNVFRFASRYFGLFEDISGSKARIVFEKLLLEYIDKKNPGDFNQALMEYGATVCAPKPSCDECMFRLECFAFINKQQSELPIKTKKVKTRNRFFQYLVFTTESHYLLNQRLAKDVWNSLYDFYLLEGDLKEEDVANEISEMGIQNLIFNEISETFVHILSHQKIHATFYKVVISEKDAQKIMEKTKLRAYTENEMLNLPKAKLIVNYLQRFET